MSSLASVCQTMFVCAALGYPWIVICQAMADQGKKKAHGFMKWWSGGSQPGGVGISASDGFHVVRPFGLSHLFFCWQISPSLGWCAFIIFIYIHHDSTYYSLISIYHHEYWDGIRFNSKDIPIPKSFPTTKTRWLSRLSPLEALACRGLSKHGSEGPDQDAFHHKKRAFLGLI